MKKRNRDVNTKNHIVPVNTLVVSEDMNLGDLYGINQNGEVVKADSKKGIKAIGIVDKTTILSKGDYICKNREDDILLKGEYIDVVDTCLVIVEDFKYNPNYAIYDYVFLGENGNMTLDHPNPTESEVQVVGLLVNPSMGVVLVRLLEYMHIVTVKPEDPIWEVTTSNTLCDIGVKQPSAHRGQWVVNVTPHSTADEETQNVSVTINGKNVPFTITEDYTVRFFIQEDGEVNISVGFSLFVAPQWDVTESFVRCVGVVTKPRRHRENWVVEVTPTAEALLGTMAVSVKLNGDTLNTVVYGNVIRFIASEDGDVDISVTFEEKPIPPVWTIVENTSLCDINVIEASEHGGTWIVNVYPYDNADTSKVTTQVTLNSVVVPHVFHEDNRLTFVLQEDGIVGITVQYEEKVILPTWTLIENYTLCSAVVTQPTSYEEDWLVIVTPNEVADPETGITSVTLDGVPLYINVVGNEVTFRVPRDGVVSINISYEEKQAPKPQWTVTENTYLCDLVVTEPQDYETAWHVRINPHTNADSFSRSVSVRFNGSIIQHTMINAQSYSFVTPTDGAITLSTTYEPNWYLEPPTYTLCSGNVSQPKRFEDDWVVTITPNEIADLDSVVTSVEIEGTPIEHTYQNNELRFRVSVAKTINISVTYSESEVDPPSGEGTWVGVQRDETNISSSLTFISNYGSTLSSQESIAPISSSTPIMGLVLEKPNKDRLSTTDISEVLNYVENK